MKKLILLPCAVFAFVTMALSQATVWQTYYSKYNVRSFADNGNSLFYTQTTQLVQFDKASGFFQYTAIPYSVLPCNSDHDTSKVYASSMVTDPAGQIWMSTIISSTSSNYWGVSHPGQTYQYDGSNWNSFGPTLSGAGLEPNLSPTFDRNGNMWFNSPLKGIVRYSNNTFSTWDTLNSHLPSQNINLPFIFDLNNNLWLISDLGVIKFDGNNFTLYDTTAMGIHNLSYLYLNQVIVGPNNTVYVIDGATGDNNYYSYNGTGWTASPYDTAVTGPYGVLYSIFFDGSGNRYFAFGTGVYKNTISAGTLLTNLPGYNNTGGNNFSGVETDASGNVWMIANGILTSFDGTTFTGYNDPRAVLESNIMLPQVFDKQGNQWLGFWGGGGLDKRTGYTFSAPIPAANALGNTDAMTVDTSGLVWFGNEQGDGPYFSPLNSINPVTDSIKSYSIPESQGCVFNYVNGLTVDKNNNIYIVGGVAGACDGFAKVSGDSLLLLPINTFTTNTTELFCITADSTNNIWIGTAAQTILPFPGVGLIKFDGTNFTNYNPYNSALRDTNIQALAVDPNNRLWVGTWTAGFSIFDGTTWTNYDSLNSPLPCNHVEWFFFKNGSAFIGTQMGFCVFDGTNWTVYTPQNSGLVDGDCESLVVDNYCNIWVATECGLSQLVGQCNNNTLKILYGKVTQDGGAPVAGTQVLLMKLDTTGGILKPIDNTITDTQGNYAFATSEPTVYVHPEPNPQLMPTIFAGYEDTALVQQQSAPIQMSSSTITSNITLHTNAGSTGSLILYGTVSNSTGGKPGAVHLYLMQHGVPVATTTVGVDGKFTFNHLSSGTYTIWVDKMSVDNTIAPSVTMGTENGTVTALLHPTYLELLSTGIAPVNPNAELRVYPNPSTGKFNYILNGDLGENASLNLYNINGQLVYTSHVATGLQTLDLPTLANGIYMLHITTALASYQRKVVIEK